MTVLAALSILIFAVLVFFVFQILSLRANSSLLKESLLKARQRLLFYYDISSFYRQDLTKEELLETFFQKLSQVPGLAKCSYFELNEEKQILERLVARGLPEEYLTKTKLELLHRVGGAATGRSLSTKKPVVANDMEADPALSKFLDYGRLGGFVSLITIPVLTAKRSYGSLIVYGERKNMFGKDEVNFGQVAANFLGQILEG